MKHSLHFAAAIVALLAGGASSAHASIISYTIQFVADNDFAIFTGTDNSLTRLIYQNNVGWPDQIAAASLESFTLQENETTFYLLGMGGGGDENISGTVNGVDVTNIPVVMSNDLSGALFEYNLGLVADGTYSARLEDLQGVFSELTWSAPLLTFTDGVVSAAAPNHVGFHFDDSTAHLFKFGANDVSGAPPVPEPSTGWLFMSAGGAILLLRRRRRTASPRN